MASQWHSLISRKIFLAKTLLDQSRHTESTPVQEALWQGAAELALRSRQLLLVMIARFYQDKLSEPQSIDALASALSPDTPEVCELMELEAKSGNWWSYIGQLEGYLSRPAAPKKTVSEDNIIAVAADTGPDRTPGALISALQEMKQFMDVLEDRHSEW